MANEANSQTNENTLKGRINADAQEIGEGKGNAQTRKDLDKEVQQEQQGESKAERIHDAYHALGEIRVGQMESGQVFTNENPQNPSEPPRGDQNSNR